MTTQQWKAYHAFKKAANIEGISVKQVIRNIEGAILSAYTTAQKESNQEVLARWREIPCAGELPTALELAAYLGEKVMENGTK